MSDDPLMLGLFLVWSRRSASQSQTNDERSHNSRFGSVGFSCPGMQQLWRVARSFTAADDVG